MKSALRYFALVVLVVAGIFLANQAWKSHDYEVRTRPLLEALADNWNRIDVASARAQHESNAKADWQREALDVLSEIETRVLSALLQDEEWQRKQDWFDRWLETSRPEPDLQWAIALTEWAAVLIDGLDENVNPFPANRAGDHLRVFRVDGERHPYRVYVPEHLSPTEKHPVVIGFHSREGNEDLFFHAFDGSKLKQAAAEKGLIFVGTTQGGLLGRCVKDGSKKVVAGLIAELARQPDVDMDNVFFLGHSRGSAAAVHCALDDENSPKAIALMAPSTTPKEYSAGPVFQTTPFMVVTAALDEHYRINGRKMYEFVASQRGGEASYVEIPEEDHFFTRETDHFVLFRQIFDFFHQHRNRAGVATGGNGLTFLARDAARPLAPG